MAFTHWLEDHFLTCSWKEHTGIDCPGCGMQRAFVALLRGDLVESIALYPPLIPMIILVVMTAVHIKFKLAKGASILTGLFVINIVIILVSYVTKLIHLYGG